MKWMRFRIRTNPASEDRMIAAMMEIGLTGAQIEDKVPLTAAEKEQIYTFDVEDPVDDGIAYVSFFAEADEGNRLKVTLPDGREVTRSPEKLQEEMQAVLSTLREGGDIGDGTLSLSLTEDIDWMNNWKQYFHHFLSGRRYSGHSFVGEVTKGGYGGSQIHPAHGSGNRLRNRCA